MQSELRNQNNADIHDVGAGGAGDEEVAGLREIGVGVVGVEGGAGGAEVAGG